MWHLARCPLATILRDMSNRSFYVFPGIALLALSFAGCGDVSAASQVYMATHNSYSGNHGTDEKGPILQQLNAGVRFIELDIRDDEYGQVGDYLLGHGSVGDEVYHDGINPNTDRLGDWLAQIATWSAASENASHAGLVVMFDVKTDLTDNPSFADGNLSALDAEVANAFGPQLYPSDGVTTAFPSVTTLTGKVMVLLSGDKTTRLEYKRDRGDFPAVAMNAAGQVVEVHNTDDGDLWYWTGNYDGNTGRVAWHRHGRFDTGRRSAVALADDGFLVEVHQAPSDPTLWYHVGYVDGNGEIWWSQSRRYDSGILPTVQFTDGSTLHEIHQSESHPQNWSWDGVLDRNSWTVSWTHNVTTSAARYDASTGQAGSFSVHVYTASDASSSGSDTLQYSSDRVSSERLRYYQRMFVENQDSDGSDVLQDGAWFYGAPATNSSFIVNARNNGKLVRGWDFDSADLATSPLANYAATNHPYIDWYTNLMTANGSTK